MRQIAPKITARGVVIKDPGWTVLEASDKAKGEHDEAQVLPPLTRGQQVNKRQADLNPGKTTPPKPYDDASLLTAMKNAGKDLADDDWPVTCSRAGSARRPQGLR